MDGLELIQRGVVRNAWCGRGYSPTVMIVNDAAAVLNDMVCVVMPTYNESGNLAATLAEVLRCNPQVDVLVVDDDSPDGTGNLADAMALDDGRIHVLHHGAKQGLGPAYVAGFAWALAAGYDVVCEMDMDGSHRPRDLARILNTLRTDPSLDLVIGSRRVPGGSTQGWSRMRNLISAAGSCYSQIMLGLDVHDMTAGFRAYRAKLLRRMKLSDIRANGYVFQIDMTRRVAAEGGHIAEVPIVFPERVRGESKMTISIVVEAMWSVTVWGIRRILGLNL